MSPTPEARRSRKRTERLAILVAALSMLAAIDGHNRASNADDRARDAEAAADAAQLSADLNEQAVTENRRTLCGAARIVSFNPVVQIPGEDDERYRHRLDAYEDFLRLSRRIDCDVILAEFKREERGRERAEDSASVPSVEAPASPTSPVAPESPTRGPRGPRGKQGEPAPTQPTEPDSPGNSDICTGSLPVLPPVCL